MDLSYTYNYGSCCEPVGCKSDEKTRKEYPTLYIRKNKGESCPEIKPDKDGMCEAVIKFRVLGYRNPTEDDKTLELEVHSLEKTGTEYEESKGIDEVFEAMGGGSDDDE